MSTRSKTTTDKLVDCPYNKQCALKGKTPAKLTKCEALSNTNFDGDCLFWKEKKTDKTSIEKILESYEKCNDPEYQDRIEHIGFNRKIMQEWDAITQKVREEILINAGVIKNSQM